MANAIHPNPNPNPNPLETLILYGNPLLGPTGEDQLQMYVEDFIKECEDVRADQGPTAHALEVGL